MGKKLFVIFSFVLIFLGIFSFNAIESNLLKAILPENTSLLIKVADKYSSNVNVIFEADDKFDAEILKGEFADEIGENAEKSAKFTEILNDYKLAKNYLLSPKMHNLLNEKRYAEAKKFSNDYLYNPTSVILLDPENDPFMLFSDFTSDLAEKQTHYNTEYGGKGYAFLNLRPKNKAEIQKLFDLQNKYSNNSQSVYLTGSPIHSYYTSERSANEINLIALVSTLFVLGITYYYFRNLKLVIPIIVSILAGIGLGFCTTSLIFKSVHVLTFVFSTTLIGICVDYSLHWFVENDKNKLMKCLTDSLITTVGAFAVLSFSNIPLLREISVFTSVGLISVYSIVKYFYKYLNFDIKIHSILPKKFPKIPKFLSFLFAIFLIFGISKINFSDNITSLYKPSETLAKSELLLNNLSDNSNKTIVAIHGKNLQDILNTEEKIKNEINAQTVSLSDFIPSINRQNENFILIKNFYKTENIDLKNNKNEYIIPNFEKYDFLNDFMVDKNTSVMVINKDIEQDLNAKNVTVIKIAKDISKQLSAHRKTCLNLIIVAFTVLFAYLFKNYQKSAIKIILPSLLGILTSLSALGWSGQTVNLFHIFAMFLILGFTLDYSIFRTYKIKNSQDAVLISCLTTSFSFFLLIFTSFKLISSLGFVLSIGIFSSYIFSLALIDNGDKNEMV